MTNIDRTLYYAIKKYCPEIVRLRLEWFDDGFENKSIIAVRYKYDKNPMLLMPFQGSAEYKKAMLDLLNSNILSSEKKGALRIAESDKMLPHNDIREIYKNISPCIAITNVCIDNNYSLTLSKANEWLEKMGISTNMKEVHI